MDAYCLADFFNLRLWPTGREATYSDLRTGLEDLVFAALAAAGASEVTLRLYGGWNGSVPASRSTLRDLTARVMSDFPRRSGGVRLRLELAEAPVWDRALTMLGTVKEVRIRHIRGSFGVPADCVQPGSCALEDFRRWAKGRCPAADCSVGLASVGTKHEQKMVDTLMVADALHIASAGLADRVVVASDDEDIIPCLLALVARGQDTTHMTRTNGYPEYYRGILVRDGLTIHEW